MSFSVFGIVLLAAALHATWNAIVKGAGDKFFTTILVSGFGGIIAASALPFLTQPAPASWPFILASVFLQVVYFILVAGAYRVADISQAYSIMRGTAPLLVATLSAALLGESLSGTGWSGVSLICCGIISLALPAWRGGNAKGSVIALLNAVVIATYTLIDGLGVRRSGAPVAYTMWIFLLTALPLAAWPVITRNAAFGHYATKRLVPGLIGGIGTVGSYGLALWAMTVAPIAVVAALRETSILFATAIGVLILGERVSTGRIAAVCVIAMGAVVLRLA
jgi:drug/metabolite transporter (DMT)-like permease